MKLIENIKNALGKRKIDKILQSNKRRLKVVNYSNAKSIGVIYPVTTTDYQYFINKFIDYLREEVGFKSIVSIGYCDTKKIPNFIINQSIKIPINDLLTTNKFTFKKKTIEAQYCRINILLRTHIGNV